MGFFGELKGGGVDDAISIERMHHLQELGTSLAEGMSSLFNEHSYSNLEVLCVMPFMVARLVQGIANENIVLHDEAVKSLMEMFRKVFDCDRRDIGTNKTEH